MTRLVRYSDASAVSRDLLLVDDDTLLLSVLAPALRHRGYDVFAAATADIARSALCDRSFSYAVVYLRLGRESGLDLVRQVASKNPAAKIVVLTGYAGIATAVEAIKRGAVHYLTKPVDAEQVCLAFGEEAPVADHR